MRGEDARSGEARGNTVEIRLPPKAEYLPIVRAAVGVAAGTASLNYDDILNLRVAVSEAFDMAVRGLEECERTWPGPLMLRVVLGADEVEVVVIGPSEVRDEIASGADAESRALLDSLVDEVEFGADADGKWLVRMVKRKQ